MRKRMARVIMQGKENECLSSPCNNNCSCVDKIKCNSCSCSEHWEGTIAYCQKDVDE